MKKKVVMNWSGGKDAAHALYQLLQDECYEVTSLLTTIQKDTGASTIHAIPRKLLELQAEKMDLPIQFIEMNENLNDYEEKMQTVIENFKQQGVTHFAFGDLYLEDIKRYRESKLNPVGIEVVEPLWNKSPEDVMNDFLTTDIQSMIIVTQADKLDDTFIGKVLNKNLVHTLPENVDLCGENGEYHTFVFDAPFFKSPIEFSIKSIFIKSYHICLKNGEVKQYEYWQADLS